MSAIASIALIGFGEVGQILDADLAAAGITDLAIYDVLFSDPASSPSRANARGRKCASLIETLAGRDLVISAVTAASDLVAAQQAAPALEPDVFFLDLNSVSPRQKRAAARIVNGTGARYIEAAVMTPFPPNRIASPMLLGGPYGEAFLFASSGLGFKARVVSPDYGKASATKMCRSVMIKGIEALVTELLLAARHYGVEEAVLASLSDLLPVGDWRKLATYMLSRSLEHGKRRAEEMAEAAETVAGVGVVPLMARACAERQEWASHYRDAASDNLDHMLDAIIAAQKSENNLP